MNQETLAALRCVNRPPRHAGTCGGSLRVIAKDELRCTRCQHRSPLIASIPHILPPHITDSDYLDDVIIQTYYEAHYAPFIQPAEAISARLKQPQWQRAGESPPVQAFDPHTAAVASPLAAAMTTIATTEALTELFYQTIITLCRPLVQPHMRVLDVGCGLGRMSGELARLGVRAVVGMDRSPRMVQEAMRILRAREPLPIFLNLTGTARIAAMLDLNWALDNVDGVVGDAQQIPFAPATFALATCLNVLDRVAQPARMIHELARVLEPGGHLIIADPYHWEEQFTSRSFWSIDMAELFDDAVWQRIQEVDDIPFVIRYYSRRVTIYLNHCLIYQKRAVEG